MRDIDHEAKIQLIERSQGRKGAVAGVSDLTMRSDLAVRKKQLTEAADMSIKQSVIERFDHTTSQYFQSINTVTSFPG